MNRNTVNMLKADPIFDWGSVKSLNMSTSDGISEEVFEKVAQVVSDNLSRRRRPSQDGDGPFKSLSRRVTATRSERLQLYGLYKQATLGNERPERPSKLNLEARLKWDAWAAQESLSKEEARTAYCDVAKQLVGKETVESIVEES